jgi:hypothetical protein
MPSDVLDPVPTALAKYKEKIDGVKPLPLPQKVSDKDSVKPQKISDKVS